MNREQTAAAVAEIAESIKEADAVFAVDYRGISVPQAADVRTRLRDADASFRVVKNTLTERAADEAGADTLKALPGVSGGSTKATRRRPQPPRGCRGCATDRSSRPGPWSRPW